MDDTTLFDTVGFIHYTTVSFGRMHYMAGVAYTGTTFMKGSLASLNAQMIMSCDSALSLLGMSFRSTFIYVKMTRGPGCWVQHNVFVEDWKQARCSPKRLIKYILDPGASAVVQSVKLPLETSAFLIRVLLWTCRFHCRSNFLLMHLGRQMTEPVLRPLHQCGTSRWNPWLLAATRTRPTSKE